MTLSAGSRVRRYEVVAPLGAGGMGEVYLARDTELDRSVALKILPHGGHAGEAERIRRFFLEARAAIALSHPNVAHVYDVGDADGVRFIAMEYVEGETLRALMLRTRPTFDEVLDIATQVASALAGAHAAGIIHRDVKPENVMLRPDGYVKVLDFGLAKLTLRDRPAEATAVMQTAPGMVMGTMYYMSPEQLRGGDVDARSDIFSLGVVLYELASGHRPFEASSPSGVIAAILTENPPPLEGVPPELSAVITKALAKNPDERFASARELSETLKKTRSTDRIRSGDVPTQVLSSVTAPRRGRRVFVVLAVMLVAAAAIRGLVHMRNVRDARAALPKIEQLADQNRYFEAWDLAASVRPLIGADERLVSATQKISAPVTISSEPPGAAVFIERVTGDGETAPRVRLGSTPLRNQPLAKGDYVLTVEKDGFAPMSRSITLLPIRFSGLVVEVPLPPLALKLQPRREVPERMSAVPGGRYRLTSWSRPTSQPVVLAPFFIDQYEVTNREFAQFVDAGGYQRPDFWKVPFIKNGRVLTFAEAMRELKDTTALSGPRGWAAQKFPAGRDEYPVTGVTWYEAAAYAEFRGKSLPTVYQWDKVARDGQARTAGLIMPWGIATEGTDVSRRANFRDHGPMPVTSLRGGMSAYGAYQMAGNVTEWCRNELDAGFAATGGAYDEAIYQFGQFMTLPGFYSSENVGFRCARVIGRGDEGASRLSRQLAKPKLTPVGDDEFAKIVAFYDYAHPPLNARVVKRTDAEAWTLEQVAFDGADGQPVTGYLFLPKNRRPPYQVIHFVPAGDVEGGLRTLTASMERMGPFVRSGRAVFSVLLSGYIGRETPMGRARMTRDENADWVAGRISDLRRGVDYLAARPDIDRERIAFYGPSAGGALGLLAGALETRYRSVALNAVGYQGEEPDPRTNPTNFAPHIRMPKLMYNGRWDETVPLDTNAMPLFDLFPEPKRLVIYDGGHVPRPELLIPALNGWFDETVGPVR